MGTALSSDDTRPPADLPLLQFGLRQFLIFVAILSVVAAVMATYGGMRALALATAVLVVGAHSTATVIGHRLRINSLRRREWQRRQGFVDPDESGARTPGPVIVNRPVVIPALSRSSPRLRFVPLFVAAGALAGGVAGSLLLRGTLGQEASPAGLAIGSVSTALMGAWVAFLMSGFWQITRLAWRQATAGEQNQ